MGVETFSARFAEEWARARMSSTKLAAEIVVSNGQVYDYRKGTTPSAAVLASMAVLFGCSMDYLWGLTDVRDRQGGAPAAGDATARPATPTTRVPGPPESATPAPADQPPEPRRATASRGRRSVPPRS